MGIDATNNISESAHASSTHSLTIYGTIWLDSAAAEGQTCLNNHFGQDHKSFVCSNDSAIDNINDYQRDF